MVMTGALALFTTSRSGERREPSFGSVASFAAWAARASGVHVLAVITAAAPMTALRMMKDRRLMPSGRSAVSGKFGRAASSWGLGSVFISKLDLGSGWVWLRRKWRLEQGWGSRLALDSLDESLRAGLHTRGIGF